MTKRMEPIIKVKKLNFAYNKGKDNEFRALINVDLEIYPEEFVVIFGPSGCGKSTLLHVIAGLETPESGEVFVFDREITKMDKEAISNYHKKEVGIIYQAYNLIMSLSVLENVTLPQIFINIKKKQREEKARQLLERFGILEQARKVPTELSGGQQQRIGITRAIINDPELILADEPVGNLDSVSAKNVLDILKDLNTKEKKTIILVTHNPENLEFADRIINMKDGIITRELLTRYHKIQGKYRAPKAPTAEINDMLRAYHGLTSDQINILIMPYKAKVFAHHFITDINMEETKVLEDVIQRRLLGTISQDEFLDILDRPSKQGGIGLDRRTAERMLRRINRAIRLAHFLYQRAHQRKNELGQHEKISEEIRVEKLTGYLLKTCYYKYFKNLNEEQASRLKGAITDRLSNKIQKTEFKNFLDMSFDEGGVGLNSKTARAMTEEMELILILGYGIASAKKVTKPVINRPQIINKPPTVQASQTNHIDNKQKAEGLINNSKSSPISPNEKK